jgi:hypothetical protein
MRCCEPALDNLRRRVAARVGAQCDATEEDGIGMVARVGDVVVLPINHRPFRGPRGQMGRKDTLY